MGGETGTLAWGEELDFEVWMRGREKKVPVKLVADSAAARLEVAQGLTLNPGHSPCALPPFFSPSLFCTSTHCASRNADYIES